MSRLLASPVPYLAIWFVLNLLQATFTSLAHDEAYYWVYAQHLDWGYFDHPPAIAFLIAIGSAILPGEIGVRLTTVLLNLATVYLFWKLVRPKKTPLFFGVLFSIMIVHVGGFFAAPDIPLLCFSTIFLFLLRAYLEKPQNILVLLLAIVIAIMLYSKYHSVLMFAFCVIPNWQLLRKPGLWMIGVLALLLFLPHLYWQWDNDWLTFRFHLFERDQKPWNWGLPANYLLGQLLIYGPLIGPLLFYAMIRKKPADQFERTLQFLVYTVFGFFFLNSFRGRIEANWTTIAFPALIYLAYKIIEQSSTMSRWAVSLAVPSILIMLFARMIICFDIMPDHLLKRNEFHGWEEWASAIQAKAGDRVVLFENNYQFPSKYLFYTSAQAHGLNDESYKGNQFDYLYENEEAIQGRSAIYVHRRWDRFLDQPDDSLEIRGRTHYLYEFPRIFSYNRIKIDLHSDLPPLAANQETELTIELHNPTEEGITLPQANPASLILYYRTAPEEDAKQEISKLPGLLIRSGERLEMPVRITAPAIPGEYEMRIGIEWERMGGKNSFLYQLSVY